MAHTTHPSLLVRLAEGIDPTAWGEFHARYHDLIRGFAVRCGLQPADCDDVTQEVLLGLCRSVSRFTYDPAKGKFRSYLSTVVIHAVSRKRRQERGGHSLQEDVEDLPSNGDPAATAAWELEWQQYHVRRAMQRLMTTVSERDRIAFVRYALQGASAREIVGDLGMTLEQLYQVKSRILKRLTGLIAEQVEEEG
jgi:RNA polymerase sigma-70 factor (ECF subfamily)